MVGGLLTRLDLAQGNTRILGCVVQHLLKKLGLQEKLRFSLAETVYLLLILLLSIAALASDTYNPFIYFKF